MKRLILMTLLIGLIGAFSFNLRPASALLQDAPSQACQGLATSDTPNDPNSTCDQTAGKNVSSLLHTAINLFSFVVGILSVLMIMIGGLKYITSSGDSNNINSAKNTILYAIVGLVVVILAQSIVRFVIDKSNRLPLCPAGATTLADGSACKAP